MFKHSVASRILLTFAILSAAAFAGAQASAPAADPWASLRFLTGTWEAKTGGGTAEAKVVGVYSFGFELNKQILARHSGNASCKAPGAFNCEHSDLLYLYPEGPAIKAIYFDNEGHTIHYSVSTPSPNSAIFLSDPASTGPQFRLLYDRKDDILSGKFQMKIPGQSDFKSYLEWSGGIK